MASTVAAWPTVALGQVLRKSDEWVDINPDAEYAQVTVRLWGRGAALRGRVQGSQFAASRQLRVRQRQFILSRIDARNGAFGLVPPELDGAVVSNDFPAFNLDETRIMPAYLAWLSKTRDFVEMCQRASEGTTNRVRLKEDRFLAASILLPPLEEQQRIVARIEALAGRIAEAHGLRQAVMAEAEALSDSYMEHLLRQVDRHPNWESGLLTDYVEVNPSRRGAMHIEPHELVSFVPMAAVDEREGEIMRPETRQYAEVSKGFTWFLDGDVIFARITPCMQNGKAAVAQNLVHGVGFGSTEFHVLRPGGRVIVDWLHRYVRRKQFRTQAAEHFTGTAGQQRVPNRFFSETMLVVPTLLEQERFVKDMQAIDTQRRFLVTLQEQGTVELVALLPSVLDKAFRGELL